MTDYLPKVRTYLTEPEVHRLMTAAASGSNGVRNSCMILFMFRHGLRINEALTLRPPQIDFEERRIHIHRLKNGFDTTHPIRNDGMILLKKWLKERDKLLKKKDITSDILFCTAKGGQMSDSHFRVLFPHWGKKAGLTFHVHPHMLRHACGYSLANQGGDTRAIQDYLGHRSILHTVKYTASNSMRFEKFWR